MNVSDGRLVIPSPPARTLSDIRSNRHFTGWPQLGRSAPRYCRVPPAAGDHVYVRAELKNFEIVGRFLGTAGPKRVDPPAMLSSVANAPPSSSPRCQDLINLVKLVPFSCHTTHSSRNLAPRVKDRDRVTRAAVPVGTRRRRQHQHEFPAIQPAPRFHNQASGIHVRR